MINDHETLDQVTTEARRSTRARSTPDWYGNCHGIVTSDVLV